MAVYACKLGLLKVTWSQWTWFSWLTVQPGHGVWWARQLLHSQVAPPHWPWWPFLHCQGCTTIHLHCSTMSIAISLFLFSPPFLTLSSNSLLHFFSFFYLPYLLSLSRSQGYLKISINVIGPGHDPKPSPSSLSQELVDTESWVHGVYFLPFHHNSLFSFFVLWAGTCCVHQEWGFSLGPWSLRSIVGKTCHRVSCLPLSSLHLSSFSLCPHCFDYLGMNTIIM